MAQTSSGGSLRRASSGPGSSYFTRPRRTSSMAITVGFFEVVGRHGPRAGLQLPRALGGHDDEAVRALFRIVRNRAVSVVSRQLCQPYGSKTHFSHNFESCQNRPDLLFHPAPASPLGLDDRRPASSTGFRQIPVHHHVIVSGVVPDLLGCLPQPPLDHLVRDLPTRARSRCSRISRDGARMKMLTASGILLFNCRAPWTSMSSTRSLPSARACSRTLAVGAVVVPEDLGVFQELVRARCAASNSVATDVVVILAGLAPGRAGRGWCKRPKTASPGTLLQQAAHQRGLARAEGAEMMNTDRSFQVQ